jgi:glucose-6-phosphate dehydrogenase assembly protein OpcA
MSSATTDSFLEGQGIPVDLANIEGELARLWGPAAQQIGGPEIENPHVTRIVLANLVVERLERAGELLAPVLETVIARFPCRAIVVCGSAGPDRQIAAEVSALCHLPAPGLPQVCSERIVLRAAPNATDLIPGAVRPLLEADLPMVLWWTEDPRKHEALFVDLADECSRLVLDLPDPGAEAGALRLGLDPSLCSCSRDTAWFGLTRWRELVAQFFDPPCNHASLNCITSVQIEALSPDLSRPPRLAIWMVAWLAGQLGWKPDGRPTYKAGGSDSVLLAKMLGPSGDVAIDIATRPIPPNLPALTRIVGLTLTARGRRGAETFRLSRQTPESPAVHVEAEATDACFLPRVIDAPELDPARRVAAALESSRVDLPFQRALPTALWLLEQSAPSRP